MLPADRTFSAGTPSTRSSRAREQVGKLIGAAGREIVWTSGATESDNLAIKGAADFYRDRGNHIITAVTEHKAVLDTCKRLEKEGFEVTYLPVEADGRVSPKAVADAMTDKTIVVSIMLANNEVGTVNPVVEIGKVVKARGAIFHIDAVQGHGQDSVRRDQQPGGPGLALGPQDVRPQGRGRLVREAQAAGAHHPDHRWRRSRARQCDRAR